MKPARPLAPVLYIPHGGGPLPLLGDARHAALVDFLRAVPAQLGTPAAILVVSAHWEEEVATVTAAANPPLLYDYYGFPEESYRIEYPAPGAPQLAHRVSGMLRQAGIPVRLDETRGFDHGLFVPLALMVPGARVPCAQLSLVRGLDPELHLRIGRALRGLRDENVLVLGSGFSFHNLRAFFAAEADAADPANEAFQEWLVRGCTAAPDECGERLARWREAPHADYCHPRAEHLLPLHVCAGIAGSAGRIVFRDRVLGKSACACLW